MFPRPSYSDPYDDPDFDPPLTKPYRELWQCSSRQHFLKESVRLATDCGSPDPGISENSPKENNDKHQRYIQELIAKSKSYNRSPPPSYIHVPQAKRLTPWANLTLIQEATMASHDGFERSCRRTSREERRASLYSKMITQHENAIEDSDDDVQDEGQMPAWLAKRRSLYHSELCIPSTGRDTASAPPPPSHAHSPETVVDTNVKHTPDTRKKGDFVNPTPCLSVRMALSPEKATFIHVEYAINTSKDSNSVTEEHIKHGSPSADDRGQLTPTTPFQLSSYVKEASIPIRKPSPGNLDNINSNNTPYAGSPGSYDYVEYEAGSCLVIRGGFGPSKENVPPKFLSQPFRAFPPLSNKGYMLTSDGHDPKFIHKQELANSTFLPRSAVRAVKATLLNAKAESETKQVDEIFMDEPEKTTKPKPAPQEEVDPATLSVDENGIPPLPHSPQPYSLLGESINYYGDESALMYCKKCGKTHILPGSTTDLGFRDPCGALLPDWFPAEDYKRPWDVFMGMNNEIKRYEDIEKGYERLPKFWDKEYHEEHKKWRAIGHRTGGWWKCRSGPEATHVENNCTRCHLPPNPNKPARPSYPTLAEVIDRRESLQNWQREHQERVAYRDRAIALEIIRETMTPRQSLLPDQYYTVGGQYSVTTATKKADETEEQEEDEDVPMSEERTILKAMWNHEGPMSTLKIPTQASTPSTPPDNDFLLMKPPPRRPIGGFHRQTSSLTSAFFASLLTPKSSPKI